jgi:endonuclease/exonuclease/phosphatase family metal-dependent hydrolase
MRPLRLLVLGVLSAALLSGCSTSETDDVSTPPPPPATAAPSHPAAIVIDGEPSDWEALPVRHADPAGDGDALDLGRLWMAHDSERLYLRLEVGATINLQESNTLTLHLDTDVDPATGTQARGIGAEASWTFGQRNGQVYAAGRTESIRHEALGLATLPTVRANVFEMSIRRDAAPGGTPLFGTDSLRVAFSGGGDLLPDADGGLTYAFSPASLPDRSLPSLDPPADVLRVLSYNVERDGLFEAEREGAYDRLLTSMAPDVIGFQELYNSSAEAARTRVEAVLGASNGASWHAAKAGLDLVLVSRFPVQEVHTIAGYDDYASGAFLLDTEADLGGPLLVVLAHPPCCNYADADPSRDAQRQITVDAIAAFLRDVQQGTAPIEVPDNTPIVVAGDMNFVGSPQQPKTVRTGEIVNSDRFGVSADPDWDASPLLDVNPRQAGAPLHATWMGVGSSFPPGRLDYVYTSDSVVTVANAFTLYTPALSSDVLSAHGLQADDTTVASDHLPLVVDLVP